jgi:hypothetical protein
VHILWCTSLLTLMCTAIVHAFLLQHAHGGRRRALGLGALIGAALLTSPAPALFVAAAGGWLLRVRGRRALPELLLAAAVAALVVAPWMLRNRTVFGEWFLLKSNFGNELWVGNNPSADGHYYPSIDAARSHLGEATLARLAAADELRRSQVLGEEARAWIRAHPTRFVSLTLSRVHLYWRARFLTDWDALPLGRFRRAAAAAYGLADDLLLALAAVGVLGAVRRRSGWWLPSGFVALFPLAYYVTHAGISRYRFPVVPMLLLLASLGAADLVAWRARRRASSPTGSQPPMGKT